MTTVPTVPLSSLHPTVSAPPPTAEQVVLLQALRGRPTVSVLLNTQPGPVMSGQDQRRLDLLVEQATARVRGEAAGPEGEQALTALRGLARTACTGATDRALALFASADSAHAVTLPVEVRERVVVDSSFATRDLVRALHRTPRHVVLVLNSAEARLFSGAGDRLHPVAGSSFPMRSDRPRRPGSARAGASDADATAFFRGVDAALGTYLRLHPAPLVLIGPDRALAGFRGVSRNLSRLAGTLEGNLSGTPLPELVARCKPVLNSYLLSRQDEALALLERRTSASRVVIGMTTAWLAARRERPEMLAVEEGLFFPARVSQDGDLLEAAATVADPDVIDDAVDELIELVLDRGGWVALVDDGLLADRDRVALTLRAHN